MKVYNTRPVSLTMGKVSLKFAHKDSSFFDHWSIHLFQSNQRFQAIEFVDRPVPKKHGIL